MALRAGLDRLALRVVVVLEHVEGIDVLAGRDVAQREGRTDASDAEESVHWLPGLTARPQCAKARATASRASNRIGSRHVTFSAIDRNSVGEGKSVEIRVDIGGCRFHEKTRK